MACVTATLVIAPDSVLVSPSGAAAVTVSVVHPVVQVTGFQGMRGPQGIPGRDGVSTSAYQAGQNLSGHRVVKVSDNAALLCDASHIDDAGKAIGITTGAAMQGDMATIQCIGNLVESSWNWLEGPVYVGISGLLTQSVTGLAFIQQIGIAGSPRSIDINPQLAIILS